MSDSQRPQDPKRRRLLDGALAVASCAAGASAAWPALRFATPPSDGATGASGTVKREEVLSAGSKLVEVAGDVVLVIAVGGELRAFSARCTHLGCTVRYARASGEIECPCHGGRFAVDGRVVAGPPPAALAEYEVTVAGDDVVIERRRAWTG